MPSMCQPRHFRLLSILAGAVASFGALPAVAQVIPLQMTRPCNAKTATIWEFVAFRAECGPVDLEDQEIDLPTKCFDIPFAVWASCGASVTFSASAEASFSWGIECIGMVEAGFSLGASLSVTVDSEPCKSCIGSVCFPDATLGLRAMQRSIPQWEPNGNVDPHEFGGLMASKRCTTITGYRTERYTLVTLRPGTPRAAKRCEPSDCLCETLGHDCNCAGGDEPQSSITHLYALPAEDCFTIDLAEFRQGDMYGAAIQGLDDLCLLELALLRRFIDNCGIACEGGTVLFRVADGGLVSIPTHAVTKAISTREAILSQTGVYKDVNRDGQVDGVDLGELILQSTRSMNAESIDHRADLNADGLIDSRDIEVFFTLGID